MTREQVTVMSRVLRWAGEQAWWGDDPELRQALFTIRAKCLQARSDRSGVRGYKAGASARVKQWCTR